ncbi:MAG: ThiF family adenylyltransferase [Phycisphaerales bacterium]
MSRSPISRNADLKRLRDEGYEVEVKSGYLLVSSIPYVDSNRQIKRGVLVSTLEMAGDKAVNPVNDHTVMFAGEQPCDERGGPLQQIYHSSQRSEVVPGLVVSHKFSAKPPGGYLDYHHKISEYAGILARYAQRIQPEASARTFAPVICTEDDNGVFEYLDTASSRADITAVSRKLAGHRIAVVGLGGTGSYVLDLVSKTHVAEIRLIDGDRFHSHNAFRCPGAASLDDLRAGMYKVEYLRHRYSAMRRNIVAIPEYIGEENLHHLEGIDFVFLCLDNGGAKGVVMDALIRQGVPFVDSGIGVTNDDDRIRGQLRVTASSVEKSSHVSKVVPRGDIGGDNLYVTNIQIAELNALCASLAVIRWKKMVGFYADLEEEHHCLYVIDGNCLHNEETNAPADPDAA